MYLEGYFSLNLFKEVDLISGQNQRNKAPLCYLGHMKEVANCGLRFRGFKRTNTLSWMHLKVKNNK